MLTVDANVWVAAAERTDLFFTDSRSFLAEIARRRLRIYLPSFAQVEIACALARKGQDADAGRQLTMAILGSPLITHVQIDASFLAQAILSGTHLFLRGADALYVATATIYGTQLISWDNELVRRAGAITPTAWLAQNSRES